MIQRNKHAIVAGTVLSSLMASSTVLASGFEKSILWSGKYAGQGNAAVSTAKGAEALYFNPAGLAGAAGTELSVNISPTFSTFHGPVATANTTVDGKQTFSPVFGAMASYAVNDKLGIGVGSYVAGGAKAEYENAAVTAPLTIKLNPKTELTAVEYAAGAGYEVMPGLKVGASVRYTQVSAALTSASMLNATTIGELALTDLKGSKFGGYRLGASYDGGNWGLGLNYRSAVEFSTNGSGTIRYESALAPGTINTGTITNPTVASQLPAQLSLGGHYAVSDALKLAAEYVWTDYHKVAALDLGGTLPAALGGASLSDLTLNFSNQSNLRLGASYAMGDMTLRGGYVYTTQVTPVDLARPTLTPPGPAHSITAGVGKALNANMDINVAGEYSTVSGTGTGNTTAQTKAGDYKASGYMFHTGVTYRM